MYRLKKIFIIFVCLVVSSCAIDVKPFVEIKPTSINESVFYFYRPNSVSNIIVSPDVIINNEKIHDIKNDRYFYIMTSPGEYNIQLQLADRYFGKHEEKVSITSGEIIYFRISTELKFQKNKPYRRSFDIQRVESELAKSEIIETKYSEYHVTDEFDNTNKNTFLKIKNKDFSTSKIRNPFVK